MSNKYTGIYFRKANKIILCYVELSHSGQYSYRLSDTLINKSCTEQIIQGWLDMELVFKCGGNNMNIVKYLYE